jgi:hypothetical protein
MDDMQVVKNALGLYGASLNDDNFIVTKLGKVTLIKVVIRKNRLRFERYDGSLCASGSIKEDTVCKLVERYWFWNKLAG